MRFHVLTLFPEMILQGCNNSILKRAMEKNLIQVDAVDIRDYSNDRHGKVDDYTYGGGAGMLMQAQPVFDAYTAVNDEIQRRLSDSKDQSDKENSSKKTRTVYVTPQGKPFTQEMVKEFADEEELIILCGHYEGIDERVLEEIVTDRVSIGDYVLTGGELPALVMIDAISRLVPDVLGSDESANDESFEKGLLEYPQYSRPEVWHDKEVPSVLLSGDHKKISEWRMEEAKKRTKSVRPDLYEKYMKRQDLIKRLMKRKKENSYFLDGLLQDMVEVLYDRDGIALGRHRITGSVMICADTLEEMKEVFPYIPKDCSLILHNCEEAVNYLQEQLPFEVGDICYQSVYTQHTAMPIAHKDIRTYPLSELDYASEHYGDGKHYEYIKSRILAKEFFAAYEGEKIVGFCGVHAGGSLGLLYVDEAYRRGSVGSSLASYLVNYSLKNGGLPYAHIRTANVASLKMQEKMGLYVANKKVFWMFKKDLQS